MEIFSQFLKYVQKEHEKMTPTERFDFDSGIRNRRL